MRPASLVLQFNVQRPLEQPPSSLGESSSATSAGASSAAGSGGGGSGSGGGSGYLGLPHHPPSSVGSVSSGGGGVGSPGSPPLSAPLPRHKEEDSGGPRSAEGESRTLHPQLFPPRICSTIRSRRARFTAPPCRFSGGVADDEDTEPLHAVDLDSSRDSAHGHGHAQYLSANCVVFTHYSGDAAAVVDEHFSRALAYADSKAAVQGKGECESEGVGASARVRV
ncbi:Protein vestigial [Frankliniella fusca]|uniref:Protein vestigial n=1 Tax=Frankliniella fusca TaxID=407009 RepID=A0AAE1HRQ5_9NEOP|nr:Protein vestigial [Frankliniella fusca]